MKKVLTKKQILWNGVVYGVIFGSFLIIISLFVPIIGLPLLAFCAIIWTIVILMKLKGIKNIHPLGEKFIEKD